MTGSQPPDGYRGGGWLVNVWWWIWRRLLSRRCPVCKGAGVDPEHPEELPSGRRRRCPRCYGAGRVAWP